ncbi:MAG: FemAB family PEP-CTERM system-associated protein [Deltaproteobacteria bacterium]|nr:FemAB family PEP-CTERM system-associated protein [Deltaproteobacteria bacterium]
MEILRLSDSDPRQVRAWDDFIRSSPTGTVFHLCAWKRVVEETFYHKPHYLLAVEGKEIRGALPLFEVHGLLSGRVLISVPYAVYGGLCAMSQEARDALLRQAESLAALHRARHVEFRHLHDPQPDLASKSLYASFAKRIDPDPDVNFTAIPRKQRRMVRQGIKFGLEARRGWELLEPFYDLFVANKRRLGSPPFPRRLFESVRDHFGEEARLLTVWHKERMVAGVISFFYKNRVMPTFSGASDEAFSLAVNDFMYWELMREACLAGFQIFDFGRSREGTGPYNFKRHWGFEPAPLVYQYLLMNGHGIPNISPSNPRLQPFIKAWKHMPLPITKWIGPALTRWLPLD